MDKTQTQILNLAPTDSARMKNRNPFNKTKWSTRPMTEADEAEAIREVAESGDSSEQDKLAGYFYEQGNLTAYVELLCRAARFGDSAAQEKLNNVMSGNWSDDHETFKMLYESTMRELDVEENGNWGWSRDDAEQYYEELIDMSQEMEE